MESGIYTSIWFAGPLEQASIAFRVERSARTLCEKKVRAINTASILDALRCLLFARVLGLGGALFEEDGLCAQSR